MTMQQGQLPVRSFQIAALKHLHADLHVNNGTSDVCCSKQRRQLQARPGKLQGSF